jgi:hypothetical protein
LQSCVALQDVVQLFVFVSHAWPMGQSFAIMQPHTPLPRQALPTPDAVQSGAILQPQAVPKHWSPRGELPQFTQFPGVPQFEAVPGHGPPSLEGGGASTTNVSCSTSCSPLSL